MRRRPLSVSELTAAVRDAVNAAPALEDVLVEGEISNLRMPGSGHLYFTLKDSASSLRCVCFRSQRPRIRFHPENGMSVVAHGRVDVYEGDGVYQLYVDDLDPAGIGALAVQVEQTLRRLREEGLFDESRKRALPLLPRRVGVVTSTTGAAVRDVCTVVRRRAPSVDVVIVPTPVQGDGAVEAVIAALRRAPTLARVDVVLLVRGGGSFEDLMTFQAEGVARAVRACPVPVVTGIGHETDTTVADHAADRRAPTPSAAAEVAVPDVAALRGEVQRRSLRLQAALRQGAERKRAVLGTAVARLERGSPLRRLPALRQGLDARAMRLRAALRQEVALKRRDLDAAAARLAVASPSGRIPAEREGLRRRRDRLATAVRRDLELRRTALQGRAAQLEALSPLRVLERGYSITIDERTGAVVMAPGDVPVGTLLRTRLGGGSLRSRVVEDGDGGGGSTA